MKNILMIVVGLLILLGGWYYFLGPNKDTTYEKTDTSVTDTVTPEVTEPEVVTEEPVVEETPVDGPTTLIGKSASGNDIMAYNFGSGTTGLLFIAGLHGGYSWNTALLGFELVDWFKANEDLIPADVKVTIIPVMNPDGLEGVTGKKGVFTEADVNNNPAVKIAGRFNANEVDLNRNFDCEWQPVGTWQDQNVSGGSEAFSEPETSALRTYVLNHKPTAVVAWYSAAGGVYASNCKNGTSEETLALTNLYAKASGYKAYEEFNYYEITGDMVNWFAKQNIPAISVLLTDREHTELSKNEAGIKAVLNHYAE